jgi:aliphatic nitrilase
VSATLKEEEGLLYAEIDLALCVEPKQIHDVVGGYNRFDIFELKVNRAANRPIRFAPQRLAEDCGKDDDGLDEAANGAESGAS